METQPVSGKLICLGPCSDWLKGYLDALGQALGLELELAADPEHYLATPRPRNRVSVLVVEQGPNAVETIQSIRGSGAKAFILWIGKEFSKGDLFFAIDQRLHCVVENPALHDPQGMELFRRAVGRAQATERTEDLLFAIKSVLLQLSADQDLPQLGELKTGLRKFEKVALQNEFLGEAGAEVGQSQIPFYKAQGFADALLSIQDLERTGRLAIRSPQSGQSGQVIFLQGRPVAAACGEARGVKAIYRVFLWDDPVFEFTHLDPSETPLEEPFALTLREVCTQGEALRVRFDRIRPKLPPGHLRLELKPSALNPQAELDRDRFSTLSSVVELGKVSQILDYNPLPDVVIYECLIELKKAGVIRVPAE